MKLLITGCARSGTKFAANWLQDRCLSVGHEKDGPGGISSWVLAAAGKSDVGLLNPIDVPPWHGFVSWANYYTVIHIVREPLACIASLTTVRDDTWAWCQRYIDIDPTWPKLKLALHYWVKWNWLAEEMADVRVQVESVTHQYHKLPNARVHNQFLWRDLGDADADMAGEAQEMSTEYGYWA